MTEKIPAISTVSSYEGNLRAFSLRVPKEIESCSGITVFGRKIRSLVFSTDIAIIRNCNADAVIAVYPFTPQPVISQAIITAADIPVFAGVGGGLTGGDRVVFLASTAENQGAIGVVINAPVKNEIVTRIAKVIDIPIVASIVNDDFDSEERIAAGVSMFNVSAAAETPKIVEMIRKKHPNFPIIATGGPNADTINDTIDAGANAITWTPPSNGEVFKSIMAAYRHNQPHP